MKLRELKAHFLKIITKREFEYTDSFEEANGIMFLCPKCFSEHGGEVGTHQVICWFNGRGVPEDLDPRPGRWNVSGTGYDDLTFVPPGAVSVQLLGGCNWHGFVNNGDAA